MRNRKPTRAQLAQQVKELKAGMLSTYASAYKGIDKMSTDHCMGSGVVVELTVLGGRHIDPVLVRDGLSAATVAAIQADLIRSQELAMSYAAIVL